MIKLINSMDMRTRIRLQEAGILRPDPQGRRWGDQTVTRSEAFGTIPEPGDVNVTQWREAYSDLHKSPLTNRYISQVKGTHQQVNVTDRRTHQQ